MVKEICITFSYAGFHPRVHTAFYYHASLIFFNLEQFFRISLFETLVFLKTIGLYLLFVDFPSFWVPQICHMVIFRLCFCCCFFSFFLFSFLFVLLPSSPFPPFLSPSLPSFFLLQEYLKKMLCASQCIILGGTPLLMVIFTFDHLAKVVSAMFFHYKFIIFFPLWV